MLVTAFFNLTAASGNDLFLAAVVRYQLLHTYF
jgi:hypothetical protein